jgi:hypothetical protein
MPADCDRERPTFTARQTTDRTEFCVLVEWPDGSKARISRFATFADAQRWIEQESDNWLRLRTQDPQPGPE